MLKYSFFYGMILYMDIEKYADLVDGEFKDRFNTFKQALVDNNKKFNLTAICDDEGIKNKHFIDSVVGENFFKKGASVVEIGSGGGFPSLPLKIVRNDLKFLLVESTGKKCNHLNQMIELLQMKNMQVFCGRAEDCANNLNYRERFDYATARAVARLNTLCEYCLPFVKIGGSFIAYKGDCEEEIEEAKKAIKVLGGKIERVEKYCLPDGDKRCIIEIKKIAPTPKNYPRGQGKERKAPIK